MSGAEWLRVPVGIDASRWVTRGKSRDVLALVHTVTSGQRVLEAVEMIESDLRVQVTFSRAPDTFSMGVDEFLRSVRGVVLPWEQASRERFDLALTASYGSLHMVHAPIVLMPHGAGYGKSVSTAGPPQVYGLDAQRLLHNGEVLPAALVLSHEHQRDVLRRQCPEALDVAVVAGDPCYDRMVASLPRRDDYRAALGVTAGERLVVVTSTWGLDSLFARFEDLLPRLLEQLGGQGFRVAAMLHPAAWSAHGVRQVEAWLADCRDAGLVLVGPGFDWRAAVVAADDVIADHGSVGVYAAALGTPVLLADAAMAAVLGDGSAQELLRRSAPRLALDRPVAPQLEAAARGAPDLAGPVRDRLTSCPGRSAAELRRAVYRLLDLPEPGRHRALTPVEAVRW
ncbi:hypothetical protein [Saccharothrix obliqua]|uniref:hypothetical protein n=1 Tax=Saccharothrix obliqua TaxID=2861747 RepID=UPI001C5FF85E|nr:hypothetical protein [Saccharothrix obliqua]MBW4720709.1 hypothetical protein [Saccharothrix obliqua]